MDEFELIKNYFQKNSKNNPSAKNLNDDVFFNKNRSVQDDEGGAEESSAQAGQHTQANATRKIKTTR